MLFSAAVDAEQATLAITPSTTSNTYYGYFTLQIGGLTSGESVQVDHYLDFNLNGVIDTNDMLVGSYRITDGQRSVIGGVTNLNVPGDSTGADGAITAALSMARAEPQFNTGTHLFRLSSPAGNWTPVTNVLTITNVIYAQSVAGQVMNGGSAVPNAFVALQQPGGGLFAGIVADGGGNYSIPAPPGSYGILAFKPGYVFNRNTAPFISLPTNQTINTNVFLVPATRTLAGSLVDSTNGSHGLPGAFLVLASAGGYFALGSTDTNGNFIAPVISDIWTVQVIEASGVNSLGYLGLDDGDSPSYDATGGNVSNAVIPLPKGTAMIYGKVTNTALAAVPSVQISSSLTFSNGGMYRGLGVSDINGNYCALTTNNDWQVFFEEPGPANYVLSTGGDAVLTNGQAARIDFLAEPSTTTIIGRVVDNTGAPVTELSVDANNSTNGFSFTTASETDPNGYYTLPAFVGIWAVAPLTGNGPDALGPKGFNSISNQNVFVSSLGATVNFTAYPVGSTYLTSPGFTGLNQFGFYLNGAGGYNYYVQSTTTPGLSNSWVTFFSTNFSQDSMILIQDNQATNGHTYYRAVRFN